MSIENWESLIQVIYFYLNYFNISGKKKSKFCTYLSGEMFPQTIKPGMLILQRTEFYDPLY